MNGLAVNLEVVRSRLGKNTSAQEDMVGFAENAAAESEQLAAIVEGVVALLELSVGAVDSNGKFRGRTTGDSGITLEAPSETVSRVSPRLDALAAAAGFGVETRETAVILTFPAVSPED